MSSAFRSDGAPLTLHASCVALDGRGLLILGAAGSGKSALALSLMSLGARLVADDRTELHRQGEAIIARCPTAIRGLIEARGIGLLHADPLETAPVTLAIDLDRTETERLPAPRHLALMGCDIVVLYGAGLTNPAPALLQMVRAGRRIVP